MQTQINTIDKIKITCKECESDFTLKIGRSLYQCPVCCVNFGIDELDDPFLRINQAFKAFCKAKNATIGLICKED